jgi:hypothetical protein
MDYNLYYLQGLGVSGITFSNNNITLINPTGGTNSVIINTLTGLTVNGNIKTTTISATTYQNLPPAVFSGGTVSGPTTFTNGLTASTISANTYQNLPQDIFVTGGTYTNGEILFKNNSGGNFTVTGLPIGGAGGEIYYLNLSQTQTPYKEFSPVGTNLPEQTTGVTVNSGVTSTIASFLTPTGYPNTTTIPAGYWSFYIHSYKDSINASLDVFCEVYVRTTGGTETLILTTEGADVTTSTPTVTMQLTDGYYSGGTIDITDRILVKVRTTNTGTQTNTITFFTEGQQHYSYGITPFSNFNVLTCETLSGCTTIVNLENSKVSKSGDTMTGNLVVPSLSATTTYVNQPDGVAGITINNINDSYIRVQRDTGDDWGLFGVTVGEVYLYSRGSSNTMNFYTNNLVRASILPNGNMGINTSTPESTLEINGGTKTNTLTANTITTNTISATTVSASTVTATTVSASTATLVSANVLPTPTISTPFIDDYNRVTLSPGGTPSLTYTNTNTGNGNSTIVTNYLNINNGNIAGQSYTTVPLASFSSPFNPTLSSNNPLSTIEWTFNLRTNRASIFSGFGAGQYGGAVVLAGSNTNLQSAGSGYALVYGSTGTRNWKLIKYNNGLAGTQTDVIAGGTFSAATNYVSARIVYAPSTNTWTYYFRDDGASAWGDPTTTSTLIGSAVDSTYTSTLMSVFGVFLNYSTAASQNLQFDNLRVQQSVSPSTTTIDQLTLKNNGGTDIFKVKDDGTTTMSGTVTSSVGFFGSFTGTHLGNGSSLTLGQSGVMVTGTTALTVSPSTTALTLIPGLSTTITVSGQTMVYIQTNGGVNTISTSISGGSAVDIAIIVDGSLLPSGGYQRIYADNPTGNATVTNWVANWNTSVILTLAAGVHTIEVDVVYVAGANATVSGIFNSIKQGTLTVMGLKSN